MWEQHGCYDVFYFIAQQHVVTVSTEILLYGRKQIFPIFPTPHEAVPLAPAVTFKINMANVTSTQRRNSSLREIPFSYCSNQDKFIGN